jgi:hypothetical protein
VLNDVLAGLVLGLRRSTGASLADLPFRWHAENDDAHSFQVLDRRTREWHRAALKPDAVVIVPGRHRRLFIEAETGTQSIATANPERTGAVLAKLARYRIFFTVPAEDSSSTWYQRAFVDACEPRLVFLVHSDRRRRKVEGAVKHALGRLPPRQFKVLVLTFEEAPASAGTLRDSGSPAGNGDPARAHSGRGREAAPGGPRRLQRVRRILQRDPLRDR